MPRGTPAGADEGTSSMVIDISWSWVSGLKHRTRRRRTVVFPVTSCARLSARLLLVSPRLGQLAGVKTHVEVRARRGAACRTLFTQRSPQTGRHAGARINRPQHRRPAPLWMEGASRSTPLLSSVVPRAATVRGADVQTLRPLPGGTDQHAPRCSPCTSRKTSDPPEEPGALSPASACSSWFGGGARRHRRVVRAGPRLHHEQARD